VIVYALVIYKRINLGNLDFAFLVWNVCTKWHHDGSDMSRAPIRKNTVAHIYLSSAESQFKTFQIPAKLLIMTVKCVMIMLLYYINMSLQISSGW